MVKPPMTENAIAKEIVDASFRIHATLGPGLLLADKRLGMPINFNALLIKDGISRIVNGLEEESHAKTQGRQEDE